MQHAGAYKSLDGGLSWKPSSQGLESKRLSSLLIDPAIPHTLYAVTEGGIFKTVDGGERWRFLRDGRGLLMNPQDSSILYAESQSIYRTNDKGRTWQLVHDTSNWNACPKDINHWAIYPQNGKILVAASNWQKQECPSGLYLSSDGGETWKIIGLKDRNDIFSVAISATEKGGTFIHQYHRQLGGRNWFKSGMNHAQTGNLLENLSQ